MNDGRLVRFELAELHLDLGRERLDQRLLVRVTRSDRLDQRGRTAEVTLAHVEQHEDRLLGEEAEPADLLLVVGLERHVADRRAGLEGRPSARRRTRSSRSFDSRSACVP